MNQLNILVYSVALNMRHIRSFTKYVLNSYHVPGSGLSYWDILVNKTRVLALLAFPLYVYSGETDND